MNNPRMERLKKKAEEMDYTEEELEDLIEETFCKIVDEKEMLTLYRRKLRALKKENKRTYLRIEREENPLSYFEDKMEEIKNNNNAQTNRSR